LSKNLRKPKTKNYWWQFENWIISTRLRCESFPVGTGR